MHAIIYKTKTTIAIEETQSRTQGACITYARTAPRMRARKFLYI